MIKDMVSVIIPVYNGEKYIAAAIESVFAQSHKNVEVIVVNDASKDGTDAVVRSFGDLVHYIPLEKNSGGPAKPRNIGIRAALGEFIAVLDADDLMLPGKLVEQVSFLNKYPEVPLVFTDFRNFNDAGAPFPDFLKDHDDFHRMPKAQVAPGWYILGGRESFDVLLIDNFIGTSGAVFRKSVVEAAGDFDETMVNSDDLKFWLCVSAKFPLGFISKVYHQRRIHDTNISSKIAAYYDATRIYYWLEAVPMQLSDVARKRIDQQLSHILFTIAYRHRQEGRRFMAMRYFVMSWARQPKDILILKSVLRCLLPF